MSNNVKNGNIEVKVSRVEIDSLKKEIEPNEKDVVLQLDEQNINAAIMQSSRSVVPEHFGYLNKTSNIFLDEILGGYFLSAGQGGSKTNALIAAQAINNTIVESGETFSFNQVVGKRTRSKGYVEGFVINANGYSKGLGGGICRVSTGIHNAVLQSGLQPVERHSHTLPIGYAVSGKDAAVVFNQWDMKFKNSFKNPIQIKFLLDNNYMYFAIIEIHTEKEEELSDPNQEEGLISDEINQDFIVENSKETEEMSSTEPEEDNKDVESLVE